MFVSVRITIPLLRAFRQILNLYSRKEEKELYCRWKKECNATNDFKAFLKLIEMTQGYKE